MIRGKSVVVTGSTSGIGSAVARAFAAEGANVTLNGFGDPEAIEQQRRSLEETFGVTAAYSGADVTKPVEVADMIAGAESTFGAIDVLVNNAGIQFVAITASHTCRCAVPGMKRRGWGRIINIASAHGLVASAQKAAYVAAKHGVVGLTKVVAIETADHGITCNAICPGWVMTPLVAQQVEARANAAGKSFEEATQEFVAEKQPMARWTRPEDIGALAVFLAGDAATTITGACYSIDGGWTAQ